MRARAIAAFVGLLLLASTTAGIVAADQGGRLGEGAAARAATAPTGLDSLLPADQLAPTGPAQWYLPWLQGGAGSNYLGQGGWRSYTPLYGIFGPYPTPQTAAFFGATNSPLDPFTTFLLSGASQGQNLNSLSVGPLASIGRSGLAPLAGASPNTLQSLGIGTVGVNAFGQPTFSVGGQTFALGANQTLGNTTLGSLLNTGLPFGTPFLPFGGASFGTPGFDTTGMGTATVTGP